MKNDGDIILRPHLRSLSTIIVKNSTSLSNEPQGSSICNTIHHLPLSPIHSSSFCSPRTLFKMADSSDPSQPSSQPVQQSQQEPSTNTTATQATTEVTDADLEQDPDVGMVGADSMVEDSQTVPTATSSATATIQASAPEQQSTDVTMAELPPAPPSRKDATLREFLSKMDDYAPIVGQPVNPPDNPPSLVLLLTR